jgi:hypothetical protein
MSIDLAKVLALPIEERIRIEQSIWDSVVDGWAEKVAFSSGR